MIRSNLLGSKSGAGLLAMSGTLQKGKTEKRQSQFGLMGNPMAFFNLLNGNMPFIGGHKEKAVGGGILSLQKDLSGKEGYKKEGGSLAGIHSSDKEAFAHFLKICGFNEKEIAEITDRITDNSGLSDVKAKGKRIIKGNGLSSNIRDNATPSIFAKTHSDKKNFKCIPGSVGHNENKLEIEKSLSESRTKGLSNPTAEFFHKGIGPSDKLINESFSAGEHQHNIAHLSNVSANFNKSDITPQILIKQIVEAAEKKLSNGLGRVKIKLHPPHLGILHMDVLVKDNKVHVILQTQNSNVSHILQSNVEQLKDSLHSQGLIVSNVNVSLQEESGNTGYGFGENRGLFKEGRNPGENRGDQKKEQDFLGHDSSILERKGLGLQKDGGISLFA